MQNMGKNIAGLIKNGGVVVFSGAGMSTESGIPDFRSPGGLWEKADLNEVATPGGLRRNPQRFLEFYRTLILDMKEKKPNKGHELLADWERQGLVEAVITQNIDFLHQQAGSKKVFELHGNLREARCSVCSEKFSSDTLLSTFACSKCQGWLRPEIVLFEEALPADAFDGGFQHAKTARTFLVLGSSLQVSPANMLPQVAAQSGAQVIIINKTPTHLDYMAKYVVPNGIGATLTQIDDALRSL